MFFNHWLKFHFNFFSFHWIHFPILCIGSKISASLLDAESNLIIRPLKIWYLTAASAVTVVIHNYNRSVFCILIYWTVCSEIMIYQCLVFRWLVKIFYGQCKYISSLSICSILIELFSTENTWNMKISKNIFV